MVRYFLELLLIAEKNKIDEYVEYTKNHWCDALGERTLPLIGVFVWSNTREGFVFWDDIHKEALKLSKEII